MTLIIAPISRRVTSMMPGNNDMIFQSNSGQLVLDQEDVFDIITNKSAWNFQGSQNQISFTKAKIMGADFEGVTERGLRRTSYKQVQREEFLELR